MSSATGSTSTGAPGSCVQPVDQPLQSIGTAMLAQLAGHHQCQRQRDAADERLQERQQVAQHLRFAAGRSRSRPDAAPAGTSADVIGTGGWTGRGVIDPRWCRIRVFPNVQAMLGPPIGRTPYPVRRPPPTSDHDRPPRSPVARSAQPLPRRRPAGRGVGISFNGQERTNVEEYCISEGWIRVAAGKALDRRGQPMTMKIKGRVEPYLPGRRRRTGRARREAGRLKTRRCDSLFAAERRPSSPGVRRDDTPPRAPAAAPARDCSASAPPRARTPRAPRRPGRAWPAGRRARSAAGGSRAAPARRQAHRPARARPRAERHRHGDRAVQLDHRRRRQLRRARRTARRCAASRSPRRARPRMAGGDRRLQRVGPERAAELLGALERRQPAADQQAIPARAVLIQQQHRLAVGADARARRARPGSPSAPPGRALRARAARARPARGRAAAPPRTAPAASSRRRRSPNSLR